ncbi:MAG: 3-deoxy-7-phosphoheptulonate synthase [Myxococcales bacterium]|nr:3-deoxy-7-phosphoheptulonate synthase [Myxococcales bacterium]
MFVTLRSPGDLDEVARELQGLGVWTERVEGPSGTVALFLRADSSRVARERLEAIEGVAGVWQSPSAHPRLDALAGRAVAIARRTSSSALLGPGAAAILASGPCSVESEAQILEAARLARRAGAVLLRGGAFKPRSSPYSFAGHGKSALSWLRAAADETGLGVVTEVMSEADVEAVAEVADVIQVGSRNMQAFALLRAVGRANKPVFLKRGMAATVEEWLLAAEHLLVAGAAGVVLCERGLRGFDPATRNLLDLGSVALVAHVLGLPVVVDPSHAAGRRDLVLPLARAALAAGAHGLLIECHPRPAQAMSDGPQALDEDALLALSHSCGFGTRGAER